MLGNPLCAPVPTDRLWFMRLSEEHAVALRVAYRLLEAAEANHGKVELQMVGSALEVAHVFRKNYRGKDLH